VTADLVAVKVVALGGGHGLAASLAALRRVSTDVTAVVTVADNGGSSGRLRREFGVLPPGDLRQALAALCGDDEWGRTWARVLQHRFASQGELDQHALGNLLIVALWELLGDHVQGLDWVARLLEAQGRVLPMAAVPLDIVADVAGLDDGDPHAIRQVVGQVEVATTSGQVVDVALKPAAPKACEQVIDAIDQAEVVVFGPGSWYTSIIPHLLVPELAQALCLASATRIVTLNLAAQPGETSGFSAAKHLDVLHQHAPDLRLDYVLADSSARREQPALTRAADMCGARVCLADLATADGSTRHDPVALARSYSRLIREESR
jgi:uncharacterized cofD-like protein